MNILQISTGVLAAIIAGGIVLLLIIILVSWWIGTSNSIKKMKISIENYPQLMIYQPLIVDSSHV